jgi:hypothetical protein
MSWLRVGSLAVLLLSGALSPALADCVSSKCSDATLVQRAREALEEACGCTRAGQTHRAYVKCVKSALKAPTRPELTLERPCRRAVLRCEKRSICGRPNSVVCCKTKKKSGKVVASIRGSATKCKSGHACTASMGLYSTFDACDASGACAAEVTTETPTTTTTTTTAMPPLGCGAERAAFEASLPVPTPAAPGRYVVQLINESNTTLLAAANAAHRAGEPPVAVLPREGTWVIEPRGVLTIDIPEAWEATKPQGSVGPVFWVRTGCRFDIDYDIAQCETGPCSGFYDCSKANQTATGPKALAEWTFNDPLMNHWSGPDLSVVDGVNLNMDIQPIGPHTEHMPAVSHWLDHPLSKCGGDQRDDLWCPSRFRLTRSSLAMFIQGTPGGDEVAACFTNCGLYKYGTTGTEPPLTCTPDPHGNADEVRCYYWKSFCLAFPVQICVPGGQVCGPDLPCPTGSQCEDATPYPYDVACTTDADCRQNGVCWDRCLPNDTTCKLTNACKHGGGYPCCAGRAFNKLPDCPPDQCTFPYTPQTPGAQPPFGLCSQVTEKTGDPEACIGEDTFHYVMPYGLTWPNDPETFFSDAHAFRIIFQPGGTQVPITPSGPPPLCKDLPAAYGYEQAVMNCSGVPDKVFSSAHLPSQSPLPWPCDVGRGSNTGSIPPGVLCRW